LANLYLAGGQKEVMDRPQVDPETHELLVAWARWARGKYLPACLHVKCGSIESKHVTPAGDVWLSAEEALKASIKAQEPISRGDEWQTERTVASLPDKPRTCLRLHYVGYRRIPQIERRKILGVTEADYWVLLLRASQMLKNRLTYR
jgi:DNA-directed RNA polymerase specialized sigma24 family protein